MRYTTAPPWYRVPVAQRILRVCDREGLADLTLNEQDFIQDLCCRVAGAEVRPFDGRDLADDAAQYAQAKITTLYSEDEDELQFDAINEYSSEFIQFWRSAHELLSGFDLDAIPGKDELQKAVRLVILLRLMQRVNQHKFYSPETDVPETLNRALTATEESALDSMLPGDGFDGTQAFMLVLELAVQAVDLDELERVARLLDEVSELETPTAAPRSDVDGDDTVLRSMESLAELGRTPGSSWALPWRLMLARAVTGELQVREPVTRRDKRQLMYILLDGTGSMQGARAGRAAGVVVNCLQAVRRGDAEVYLRFFDVELGEAEYHADSIESADELIRVVSNPYAYIGAGTRFDAPLEQARVRVGELVASGALRDEELFLVTDGRAPVPGLEVLGGVKLHVIQVGSVPSAELDELADMSGGVHLFVGQPEEMEMDLSDPADPFGPDPYDSYGPDPYDSGDLYGPDPDDPEGWF